MDDLFETESETSNKEADNYKCVFCKKMYNNNTELIKHVELCDVEENKESEEDGENISFVPSAKKSLRTAKKYWITCRCNKSPRDISLPSAKNFFSQSEGITTHMEEHLVTIQRL